MKSRSLSIVPPKTSLNVSVFDYYRMSLDGRVPSDETLKDLPVNSVCGADCKRVIDSARAMINEIEMAYGKNVNDHRVRRVVEIATEVVECFWRG